MTKQIFLTVMASLLINSMPLPAAEPGFVFSVKTWEGEYYTDDPRGVTPVVGAIYTLNGDGTDLKKIAQLGMNSHVSFKPDVSRTELRDCLQTLDVFVLPSENEPWGLIVNEAMCAGLPLVVSKEVGCVADLVMDGVNGLHAKAGNVDSLTAALEKLLTEPMLRKQMGTASRSMIRGWSYEQCRQGIMDALQHRLSK